MQEAPQVTFAAAQAPSPRVSQYPAPYAPSQTAATQFDMTEMITAIMPIFMIMMLMMVMRPMMSGFATAK